MRLRKQFLERPEFVNVAMTLELEAVIAQYVQAAMLAEIARGTLTVAVAEA